MHNVARNCQTTYPQPLRMPRTCAHGPNLREVGIWKRQPNHTPPGILLGERMQCSVWVPGTLPCLCRASALYIARFGARRPLLRSACHLVRTPPAQIRVRVGSSDPHATHPIRAPSSDPRHPAGAFFLGEYTYKNIVTRSAAPSNGLGSPPFCGGVD